MSRGRARLHPPDEPVSRRSGVIPGRRLALVLTLALGALGSASTASASADVPLVSATILGSAGAVQDSVTVATLEADQQHCPAYSGPGIEEHARQQPFTYNPPAASWSVGTILGCLQNPLSLHDVTAVTIINRDGSAQTASNSQLSPDDLASPGDFRNPDESPIIESLGSTFQYDRPWRGGTDNNLSDEVQMPTGSPVTIEVFEGPSMTVKASASPSTVQPGGTIGFSVTVVSPANATGLSYSWDFDGAQAPSSSSTPTATFSSAGTYDVGVQVTDSAGGSGFDTIPITVGSGTSSQTTPTQPTTTGPTTTPTHTSTNGSNPSGSFSGGRHGDTHGSKGGTQPTGHGRASNPTSTSPSASPGTSSTGGSAGQSGSGGSSASSTGTGTGTGTSTTAGSHGTRTTHPPAKPRRTPPSTTSTQRTLVTGRLISDVIPIPAGASPLVHPAPASIATPAAARPASGSAVAPVLGGTFTILLLLSVGAARELRGRRDWRALRFGS